MSIKDTVKYLKDSNDYSIVERESFYDKYGYLQNFKTLRKHSSDSVFSIYRSDIVYDSTKTIALERTSNTTSSEQYNGPYIHFILYNLDDNGHIIPDKVDEYDNGVIAYTLPGYSTSPAKFTDRELDSALASDAMYFQKNIDTLKLLFKNEIKNRPSFNVDKNNPSLLLNIVTNNAFFAYQSNMGSILQTGQYELAPILSKLNNLLNYGNIYFEQNTETIYYFKKDPMYNKYLIIYAGRLTVIITDKSDKILFTICSIRNPLSGSTDFYKLTLFTHTQQMVKLENRIFKSKQLNKIQKAPLRNAFSFDYKSEIIPLRKLVHQLKNSSCYNNSYTETLTYNNSLFVSYKRRGNIKMKQKLHYPEQIVVKYNSSLLPSEITIYYPAKLNHLPSSPSANQYKLEEMYYFNYK